MMILISCAKTMSTTSKLKAPITSVPQFADTASELALYVSQFGVDELEQSLKVNSKIAVDTYLRYQEFHSDSRAMLQALFLYTGVVYKHIDPSTFTDSDFAEAQKRLRIGSPLYGLLKPMDLIKPYRLEFDVLFPELGGITLTDFWRTKMTDSFIEEVKQNGGVLVNLASAEVQGSLDWKRVTKEVKVITPEFKIWKNAKLKTIVVYTKMCRGEMTRYILKNKIQDVEALKDFSWEGYRFYEEYSEDGVFTFVC